MLVFIYSFFSGVNFNVNFLSFVDLKLILVLVLLFWFDVVLMVFSLKVEWSILFFIDSVRVCFLSVFVDFCLELKVGVLLWRVLCVDCEWLFVEVDYFIEVWLIFFYLMRCLGILLMNWFGGLYWVWFYIVCIEVCDINSCLWVWVILM